MNNNDDVDGKSVFEMTHCHSREMRRQTSFTDWVLFTRSNHLVGLDFVIIIIQYSLLQLLFLRRAQPHNNLMQLCVCVCVSIARYTAITTTNHRLLENKRKCPSTSDESTDANSQAAGTIIIIIIPAAFILCERIYNSIIIFSRLFQGTSKYLQHRLDNKVLLRHVWVCVFGVCVL